MLQFTDCQLCKLGYNHWQCEWEAPNITEADHHYQNGHDDLRGDGVLEIEKLEDVEDYYVARMGSSVHYGSRSSLSEWILQPYK